MIVSRSFWVMVESIPGLAAVDSFVVVIGFAVVFGFVVVVDCGGGVTEN